MHHPPTMIHNAAATTCAPPEVKTTGFSVPVAVALGTPVMFIAAELVTTSELVIKYLVSTPSSFFDFEVGKTKLLSPFEFDRTETVSVTVDEEGITVVSTSELERASRRRLASMFVVAGVVMFAFAVAAAEAVPV